MHLKRSLAHGDTFQDKVDPLEEAEDDEELFENEIVIVFSHILKKANLASFGCGHY